MDIVQVGFNLDVEADTALRLLAAKRRVDKTTVLREAVRSYLMSLNDDTIHLVIDAVGAGHMTPVEAKTALALHVERLCKETRAAP